MILDVHEERKRLRDTGEIDPLYAASELHADIAKRRVFEAVTNCELMKARAEIKAKINVNRMVNNSKK